MSISEFDLIDRYFKTCTPPRADVAIGIGDDAALVAGRAGSRLVTALCTVCERSPLGGVDEPATIARRALAVAFHRVAIAGASPAWVTLALTLPSANDWWLQSFATAFGEMAARHGAQLIGGNTTRGPFCITVTVDGIGGDDAEAGRAKATGGDIVCVSGRLGVLSALLLAGARPGALGSDASARIADRAARPELRVALALALAPIASAACEISDGLLPALEKVLTETGLGATVRLDSLPMEAELASILGERQTRRVALSMGGDMELCLILAPSRWTEALAVARLHGVDLSIIGTVEAAAGVRVE